MIPRPLVVFGACCLAFTLAYAAFSAVLHTLAPADVANHAAILSYLDGTGTPPAFLSDAEASHMRDVKRLVDGAFILHIVCVGILIGITAVFWKNSLREEWFARVLRAGGSALAGIAVFLILAALLGFDRLFVLFHALLFPQGNWLFPADSALITTYPSAYFDAFALWWLSLTIVTGLLMALLGTLVRGMARHAARFKG